MNINIILIFIVAIESLITLYRGIKYREIGWVMVSLLIIIVTSVTYMTMTEVAGVFALFLYFVFIALPRTHFDNIILNAINTKDYNRAKDYSLLVSFIHPFDKWLNLSEIFTALNKAKEGNFIEADNTISKYTGKKDTVSMIAYIEYYKLINDWQELLTILDNTFVEKDYKNNPYLLTTYLQALGKTGRINYMFEQYDKYKDTLAGFYSQHYIKVLLLAYAGMQDAAKLLIYRFFYDYENRSYKDFWIDIKDVTEVINSTPVDNFSALNDNSKKVIEEIILETKSEERMIEKYQNISTPGTSVLIGIVIAVMLVSFLGLAPIVKSMILTVKNGEVVSGWWTFLTYIFVHSGFIHLFFNTFALAIIGPLVEIALGTFRYLLCFFITGVGAGILTIFVHPIIFGTNTYGFVGASGSIMGLLGSLFFIRIYQYMHKRSAVRKREVLVIVFILIAQFLFDMFNIMNNVNIATEAHFLGFSIGFIFTAIIFGRPGLVSSGQLDDLPV